MPTTERTSIRRRLAIRRTAPRPPWGARKAGHGFIVAPLAATLATSVALGLGLALARVERQRRRADELDRELGLAPGERDAEGLHRMALAQLDLALELLGETEPASTHGLAGAPASLRVVGDARPIPNKRAVHETRKAIKRLRALLRLLRSELGERAYAREDAVLAGVAQRLSEARDAAVMLATLDALIARHPRRLGRRRGVIALRERVAGASARTQDLTLSAPHERAAALGELRALRWRVSAWSLPASAGASLIDADLERLYAQGRQRHRRAARAGKDARTHALHRWRKRVKDLRYAAEMLERRDAHDPLHRIAARADTLGEVLGEEHDLAVLEERLRAGARHGKRRRRKRGEEDALWHCGRASRKALLGAIAKRRRTLRKRALRKGRRLYEPGPRRFMRELRRLSRR